MTEILITRDGHGYRVSVNGLDAAGFVPASELPAVLIDLIPGLQRAIDSEIEKLTEGARTLDFNEGYADGYDTAREVALDALEGDESSKAYETVSNAFRLREG